jgi:hypothetical protein
MFTLIYNVRGLKIVMALKIAVHFVIRETDGAVQYDLCFVPSASRSKAVLPKYVK